MSIFAADYIQNQIENYDPDEDYCPYCERYGDACDCDIHSTAPDIITVQCEKCGKDFETIDEGRFSTETKCGCHIAMDIDYEPPF